MAEVIGLGEQAMNKLAEKAAEFSMNLADRKDDWVDSVTGVMYARYLRSASDQILTDEIRDNQDLIFMSGMATMAGVTGLGLGVGAEKLLPRSGTAKFVGRSVRLASLAPLSVGIVTGFLGLRRLRVAAKEENWRMEKENG